MKGFITRFLAFAPKSATRDAVLREYEAAKAEYNTAWARRDHRRIHAAIGPLVEANNRKLKLELGR